MRAATQEEALTEDEYRQLLGVCTASPNCVPLRLGGARGEGGAAANAAVSVAGHWLYREARAIVSNAPLLVVGGSTNMLSALAATAALDHTTH